MNNNQKPANQNRLIFPLLTFFIVFSLFLKLYNLSLPSSLAMDEQYYVPAARAILAGEKDPNLEHHPPLAKEIIGMGIKVLGDNPLGWRMPSVIFGCLGLLLTYWLALLLFKKHLLALLSAVILSFSSLWLLMSRLAMLDIFAADFLLLTLIFLYAYWRAPSRKNAIFLGLSLGLLLSSKWIAILAIFLFPFLLIPFSKQKMFAFKLKNPLFKKFLLDLILILVLTLGIYAASYLPYLIKFGPLTFPQIQFHILTRHLIFIKKDATYSPFAPFAWPFIPASGLSFVNLKTEGLLSALSMIENPLLLWTFLPLLVLSFVKALQRKNLELLFLGLCLVVLYVPWLILDRPKYFFYMLPLLPVLSICLAFFLEQLWQKSHRGRILVSGYLIALAIFFLLAYPLIAALPVSYSYLYKVFFFWPWLIGKI